FPLAAIAVAVATPIAAWWLLRLWQRPTIATLLAGYALTLLAFLFFGRYFQGNYLGFIVAVFTPIPFLTLRQPRVRRVRGLGRARGSLRPGLSPLLAPDGRAGSTPAALPEAPSPPPLPPSPAPVPLALETALEPSSAGVGGAD